MITVRQTFISSVIAACPRQAYLTYIEKIPVRRTVPLEMGTIFHSTYEHYYKARIDCIKLPLSDVADFASEQIAKVQWQEMESVNRASFMNDVMAMVISYYPHADLVTGIKASEKAYEIAIDNFTITTHIDLETDGTEEFKTARVFVNSQGKEYFPDYAESQLPLKPQPWIHALSTGLRPYRYHVIGKGEQPLVKILSLRQTETQLAIFREHVLKPTLSMIEHGLFPARRSGLCSVCPFAKERVRCGMLL